MDANTIVSIVCDEFSITPTQLYENTRKRDRVEARQMVFYFCKEFTKYSLEKIGRIGLQYGAHKSLDHSTTHHGIKTIKNLIDANYRPILKKINSIEKEIKKFIEEEEKVIVTNVNLLGIAIQNTQLRESLI